MTDEELLAVEPIEIGYRHFRNPFAGVDDELAHRWSKLHWDQPSATTAQTDDLAALFTALDGLDNRAPWHEIAAPNGAMSIYPLVPNFPVGSPARRKQEDEWETRCQEMHDNQHVITLDDKPKIKKYEDHAKSLKRGN